MIVSTLVGIRRPFQPRPRTLPLSRAASILAWPALLQPTITLLLVSESAAALILQAPSVTRAQHDLKNVRENELNLSLVLWISGSLGCRREAAVGTKDPTNCRETVTFCQVRLSNKSA